MRYFTFNFVARKQHNHDGRHFIESIADEIHVQSNTFPSKTEILDSINKMHENLRDVTITHKFEFNHEQDFRDYVGSWRIISLSI